MQRKLLQVSLNTLGIAIILNTMTPISYSMDAREDQHWKGGDKDGPKYHQEMSAAGLLASQQASKAYRDELKKTHGEIGNTIKKEPRGIVVCACCKAFQISSEIFTENFYNTYWKPAMERQTRAPYGKGNYYRWVWVQKALVP